MILGQNIQSLVNNDWDIADIEFSVGGGGVGGSAGGVQSHFHVKPNFWLC